jgi:hypothetical protein
MKDDVSQCSLPHVLRCQILWLIEDADCEASPAHPDPQDGEARLVRRDPRAQEAHTDSEAHKA